MTLGPLEVVIITAVIWAILYGLSLVLPLKKYGLQVKPLYFIYKTKRFNIALNGTARRFKQLWRIVWNVGIASSFGLMGFAIYSLISNLIKFFQAPAQAGPTVLLLPGITIGLNSLPYFLVALAVIMVPHEVAHGIASRLENIEIQSSGIIVAFLLFGAFVEPDEEQLSKAKLVTKERVYGAGSLVNLLTAILAIIVLELIRSVVLLGIAKWELLPLQILYFQISWIGLLALNVAIFNMLPLYPLDGDGIIVNLIEELRKGTGHKMRMVMSSISLLILAMNIIFSLFRFGLTTF